MIHPIGRAVVPSSVHSDAVADSTIHPFSFPSSWLLEVGLMNRILCISLVVVCWLSANCRKSSADVLFESGTLGPTGVSWSDLASGTVPGSSINAFFFPGVRFHLNERVITTQVGGHFAAPFSGTFFGAIVELESQADFPDSINLSTSDVHGATVLMFPTPSAEVFGDLTLSLDPGWYALVFGSGLFGTNGSGGAVRNGMDIEDPSYIAFDPNLDWFDLDIFQTPSDNRRFLVEGYIVPEPNALNMVLLLLVVVSWLLRVR